MTNNGRERRASSQGNILEWTWVQWVHERKEVSVEMLLKQRQAITNSTYMSDDMFNPPLFQMEGNDSQNEPAPVIPVCTCVRLFPLWWKSYCNYWLSARGGGSSFRTPLVMATVFRSAVNFKSRLLLLEAQIITSWSTWNSKNVMAFTRRL